MRRSEIGIYAGSKIPQNLKDGIAKAIAHGNYLNASDFIRDAIKEKLDREGLLGSGKLYQSIL
jgi:Arc/MetJ-type ribon-helix-helix transcriptional regulator